MQDSLQCCIYFTIFPSLPLIFPEPSPGRLTSLSITETTLLRVTEDLCVTRFNGLSLPLAGSPPQQCWSQMTLPSSLDSEHRSMASYSLFSSSSLASPSLSFAGFSSKCDMIWELKIYAQSVPKLKYHTRADDSYIFIFFLIIASEFQPEIPAAFLTQPPTSFGSQTKSLW